MSTAEPQGGGLGETPEENQNQKTQRRRRAVKQVQLRFVVVRPPQEKGNGTTDTLSQSLVHSFDDDNNNNNNTNKFTIIIPVIRRIGSGGGGGDYC